MAGTSAGWCWSWRCTFLPWPLADAFLPLALGPWTLPAAIWSLFVHPLLWTALAAWFLASWVCLFRRCERNQPDADEWVRRRTMPPACGEKDS